MGENTSRNITFDFSGQRFVVTGASSGIGRCIALELAENGAEVLAIARREKELKEVQEIFPERIYPAAIDVTNFDVLKSNIEQFAESGKISGSVHAAGINGFTPLSTFKKNAADEFMNINLWAGVELVRLLSRKKYMAKNSAHVLISSAAGIKAQPGFLLYGATKSAMINVVSTMALELATLGTRVNAVSPGMVNTDMSEALKIIHPSGDISAEQKKHPLGFGEPKDVSGVVLFLLSDGARWITGSNIVVDGGYLA